MDAPTTSAAPVGVVLVGHGDTASRLLEAASAIVSGAGLSDVIAVDAGVGETPDLSDTLCSIIEQADAGRGVLLVVDLMGASPCTCGMREAVGHRFVVLSGLNLAILLKLASLDRRALTPAGLANACAESGRKSVCVEEHLEEGTAEG